MHPIDIPETDTTTPPIAIFTIGMGLGSFIGSCLTAIAIHAGGLCQ